MKTAIHPNYHTDGLVSCACGNTFKVGMTKPELRVEICAKCHPFFTGEMRFLDAMGRVEKFQKKQEFAQTQVTRLADKKKKKKGVMDQSDKTPKSLKEMLMGAK